MELDQALPPPPQLQPLTAADVAEMTSQDMQTRAEYVAWVQEVTGERLAMSENRTQPGPPVVLEITKPIKYDDESEASEWVSVWSNTPSTVWSSVVSWTQWLVEEEQKKDQEPAAGYSLDLLFGLRYERDMF